MRPTILTFNFPEARLSKLRFLCMKLGANVKAVPAEDFCQPIYEEWFAEAVARGRIHAPGFFSDPAIRKAYTACAWNGPARTNLNPVQEVDAAIKRVEAGFSTAQQETAQMTGGDYNRNIEQRIMEATRKRKVDEIVNRPMSIMA